MSAEAAILTRSWPVGDRTCTLTVQRPKLGTVMAASAEWSPSEPVRLNADEWHEYRSGRNRALAEFAAELGITVAVLDL